MVEARLGSRLLLVGLALGALGCTGARGVGPSDGWLQAPRAVAPQPTLRLVGTLRGPLPGLGPRVDIDLFLRADRGLRADLRSEGERGATHEVLVWTRDAAILFDRRRLRFIELGPAPGQAEVLGGLFRVEELWWMLFGGGGDPRLDGVEFSRGDGQWRGRAPQKGYRQPDGTRPAWSELLWRGADGRVHHLRAERSEPASTPWGPLPTRITLEGSDLEGRAILEWRLIRQAAMGDSILDPTWEPRTL